MNDFPKRAEEFYALRDDRTDRCVNARGYQRVQGAVLVSSSVASGPIGQTMLLAAANLLSRWCRRVTIVVPPTGLDASLGMGTGDLGEAVLAQMRDADPFGDFSITHDGTCRADIELHIGARVGDSAGVPVFINGSGWLASISRDRMIDLAPADERNWLGGIAAACLGVAQMFKIAIGVPVDLWLRDGVFDLFRLAWSEDLQQAPWPQTINVGKILMVGAGSVGSSAAYCLRVGGLAGALTVVDRDSVKVENFNRSPVFGRTTWGLTKADAVAQFLTGSSLAGTPMPIWWDEFMAQRGRRSLDFDLWLPLANEFGVRLAMQHNVPPLMIHASTTSNWGVNHGRHVPGMDDCLADRFPADTPVEHLTCATGKIVTPDASVDAALPFASMFAGLLVAADVARAQLPEYPQVPNFALFDWYGPLDRIHKWDRKPRPGCVCQDQGAAFHARFNAGTKYRKLFRFG